MGNALGFKAEPFPRQAGGLSINPVLGVRQMSEKEKKMTKSAEVSKPGETVADQIIGELDRVHMRVPKY